MKRLSIALLLLGLAGCGKYPSSQKGLDACAEWVKAYGGSYKHETIYKRRDGTTNNSREVITKTYPYTTLEQIKANKGIHQKSKINNKDGFIIESLVVARHCEIDESEKQWLGYENKAVIDMTWRDRDGARGKMEVVKHFRY